MQNSIELPPEEDYITNFIVRLVTAYRVLTSKNAIVVIDNDLISYQNENDTAIVLTQITHDLSNNIAKKICEDVYNKPTVDLKFSCN